MISNYTNAILSHTSVSDKVIKLTKGYIYSHKPLFLYRKNNAYTHNSRSRHAYWQTDIIITHDIIHKIKVTLHYKKSYSFSIKLLTSLLFKQLEKIKNKQKYHYIIQFF